MKDGMYMLYRLAEVFIEFQMIFGGGVISNKTCFELALIN